MPHTSSQTFLRELDKKLWTAAGKPAVPGLIFIKYVSDSFNQRQTDIAAMRKDPENDFFVDPAGYDTRGGGLHPPSPNKPKEYFSNATYEQAIHRALQERDYHIQKYVLSVPELARSKTFQDCQARMRSCKMRSHPAERPRSRGYSAKLPAGTQILNERGRLAHSYKITSTDKLIDIALESVEKEKVRNGDLRIASSSSRRWAIRRSSLPNLAGLIDLIATIPFQHADLHAKDILGHTPRSQRSKSHSASLGDLCAFAVKNSSMTNRLSNFAWVQHMLHHLAPNGSMRSNSSGEGDIRRALANVAMRGQLFTNWQSPPKIKAELAVVFRRSSKEGMLKRGVSFTFRDRRGETLFIGSHKLGYIRRSRLGYDSRQYVIS